LVVEKWLTPAPDTKGKFILIDFWATWCGPCRKAIPELNKFQKQFSDKLVVIGISDESEDAVRRLTNPAMEYASAIDPQGRMKKQLEVKGIPHVIVIDPQGIVRWEGYPLLEGFELTESALKEVMTK
jgi:cytochrome c biogenesis protein CcmG/thiol:disulfide interchange protein DsbE